MLGAPWLGPTRSNDASGRWQAIEISDELTGQPHDLENLIVQEFVDHDLELRLYVVDGEAPGMGSGGPPRVQRGNG